MVTRSARTGPAAGNGQAPHVPWRMPFTRYRSATAAMTMAVGAATLVLAGCGSSTSGGPRGTSSASTSAAVKVIDIKYRHGQITPPPSKIRVPTGTSVVILVTTDVPEEVRNGYNDKLEQVPAGGTAFFQFTATRPGVYEERLPQLNKVLMQLQVG